MPKGASSGGGPTDCFAQALQQALKMRHTFAQVRDLAVNSRESLVRALLIGSETFVHALFTGSKMLVRSLFAANQPIFQAVDALIETQDEPGQGNAYGKDCYQFGSHGQKLTQRLNVPPYENLHDMPRCAIGAKPRLTTLCATLR